MNSNIDWIALEIPKDKEPDSECLEKFFNKYISKNRFQVITETIFMVKYNLAKDKEKFLFDEYLNFRSFNSYLTLGYNYDNQIDLSFDAKKLIDFLNIEFSKFGFSIKYVKDEKNRKEILFLSGINENIIFKKKKKWESGEYSEYFLVTLYKNRILLKDFNRVFRKSTAKKFLEKMTEFLRGEISPLSPKKINFKDFLNVIKGLTDIKTIEFISEKIPESPIIKIVCRKDLANIKDALQNFIDEGYIRSMEDVTSFSVQLKEEKIPLYVSIEHKFQGIPEEVKAIKFRFSHLNLGIKAEKILSDLDLGDYYLYFENKETNFKQDLELLIYKKQLNLYEETWYKDSLRKLVDKGLITLEKKGGHSIINLEPLQIYNAFEIICKENKFKIKEIKLNGLKKYSKDFFIVDLDFIGKHFLLIFFLKKPSGTLIQQLKNKWIFSLLSPPLFVLPAMTKYGDVTTLRDYPFISLSDFIYSFFDDSLLELLKKKVIEISVKYRQEREKSILKEIAQLEDFIKNKRSDLFHEFEEGMYYLHSVLFPSTQKIGGGYLPDGIQKVSLRLNDIGGVDIWDSKIWFSNFDTKTETDKMEKYILASLRNDQINSLGNLNKYFFIGHLEDPKVISKMFAEAKTTCKNRSKRYNIHKKDVDNVVWRYLGLEFYKRVIEWSRSKSEMDLLSIDFYSELEKFLDSRQIFQEKEAEDFIKGQEDNLKKNKSQEIDIKKYRKDSKNEVFSKFN